MNDQTRRDELAEVRSHLRETWPSLTDADVDSVPRTRREALDDLQERLARLTGGEEPAED